MRHISGETLAYRATEEMREQKQSAHQLLMLMRETPSE